MYHQTNVAVVVIEGDETIDPSKLRVVTMAGDQSVVWAFHCRTTAAVESVEVGINEPYVRHVYAALRLSELVMSVSSRVSAFVRTFMEAIDRPRPDAEKALAALDDLDSMSRLARQEINGYATRPAQEAPRPPEGQQNQESLARVRPLQQTG